jgi:hypothetical protein
MGAMGLLGLLGKPKNCQKKKKQKKKKKGVIFSPLKMSLAAPSSIVRCSQCGLFIPTGDMKRTGQCRTHPGRPLSVPHVAWSCCGREVGAAATMANGCRGADHAPDIDTHLALDTHFPPMAPAVRSLYPSLDKVAAPAGVSAPVPQGPGADASGSKPSMNDDDSRGADSGNAVGPHASAPVLPPGARGLYTVPADGATVAGLAIMHGVSPQALREINALPAGSPSVPGGCVVLIPLATAVDLLGPGAPRSAAGATLLGTRVGRDPGITLFLAAASGAATEDDAIAYLAMHEGDAAAAAEEFLADLAWERETRGIENPTTTKKSAAAASTVEKPRGVAVHDASVPRELEMAGL